jgi:Tfp pilus assembly protein PilN
MNAVNLIPRDGRSGGAGLSVSPPTLALISGLILALIAAVVYVTAANTVATRKSELAQVSAGVAEWTAAGNSYNSFVSVAKNRTQELADVRQLASARFPWSNLLGQIGDRMPPAAALSTLQADTSSAGDASSTASAPGVQMTGCAASQSAVAQTMVQLRLVSGISAVTLSTSGDSSAGSGASGSGSSACPFPVQFQLALTITPSYAAGGTSSSSASTTSAPAATTSTPAGITSTPAAAQ